MSGGGGRRWAVAAVLLLVPELVGDGDCERAHQRGRAPETGGWRRRVQRERESSLRRGGRRGLRRRLLLRPLVGARERLTARCPQPPGSLLPALPFPVCPPRATRAAALTATRTRAPWRTRALGHLWRLDPLSGLKGLLPREGGLVSYCGWKRLRCSASRSAVLCLLVPGVMSYLRTSWAGFHRIAPQTVHPSPPSLAGLSPTGHPDPLLSLQKWAPCWRLVSLGLLPFNPLSFHLFC